MQITDEILDIVFRNDENGYTVLRLKQSNMTATGIFAHVSIGAEVKLSGEYIENAKYGRQFKVSSYEFIPPNTPSKIKLFIGSGLIEGIGPVTAERIVKTFGADTLKIMESAPEELTAVRGISMRKAGIIGEKYREIKGMQHAVMFLQKFAISLNMAMKIYKYYGEKTIERVQANPYMLIETIDGIGFKTADDMAKNLGHDYSGTFRVRAGVVYCLKQASDGDGHTFLPHERLMTDVCKLLRIRMTDLQESFEVVIRDLCLDRFLTEVTATESKGYMLSKFHVAEKGIAGRLVSLENNIDDSSNFEIIKHYEQLNKIKLHENQIEAIKLATKSGVCVITGGPGTGKTTIVQAILYMNDAEGLTTQLLAPTGRAAKRLEETTGRAASTIHRALDLDFGGADRSAFTYDEREALTADVIIVDEFSMCDVLLTNHLLKKVLPATRLVFVGDVDQLPSVGAGSVLADIIESGVVPVVCLSEIYRQSEQSQIVTSAHAINNGDLPDLTNKSSDFFFVRAEFPADIKKQVVTLASSRIPAHLKIDSSKIQVLCPMKMGEAGMTSLNVALQESMNPSALEKAELEYKDTTFRIGDRVMNIANNYNQEWRRASAGSNGFADEVGSGVYNGDIGVIVAINRYNGEVTVELEDGRQTIYTRGDLPNLVLAYAITVHKSQGCEFDVVIIPVTAGAYMILTRNLLYTAVTRAKKMVVLVGSDANISKMVNNTYTKKRFTMLSQFLKDAKDKIKILQN